MNLREQLQQDLRDAMRARDKRRKSALRVLIGNIQTIEGEKGTLDDDEVLRVLEKEVKKREEALEIAREAGRDDIVATDAAELEALKSYLPEPFSEEELVAMVESVIAEVDASSMADMGMVMQTIMPRVRGKANGSEVSRLVRERLQGGA